MPHASAKDRSRGLSGDMSSKALSRRLDILADLRELGALLAKARRSGTNDGGTGSAVHEEHARYGTEGASGE